MLASLSLLALPLVSTSTLAVEVHSHNEHNIARPLSESWYQHDDHPVHALFKRAGNTDGTSYAAVGSSAWKAGYPTEWATPTTVPQAWTDALNSAVSNKVIPDVPVAKVDTSGADGSGVPTYPAGNDPNSPSVCSASYQCRIPGDVWDAPNGYVALSFDDGPTSLQLLKASDGLSSFLLSQNQTATHFMIGSNLLDLPDQFSKAFGQGDDIAVHTWSHPYMTTLTNTQVVAELGWTIQLIHNSTGGRVPRFWRPPYGDSDLRTRAIAKEVFGLTTVIWNQDTDDWSLTDTPPGTTQAKINASMTTWLTSKTKSPGLVILEHELSDQSVQAFKNAYPVMKKNNWNVVSLATLMGNGTGAYLNAETSGSAVTPVGSILNAKNASLPVSSSSALRASTAISRSTMSNPTSLSSPSPIPNSKSSNNAAVGRFSTSTIFTLCLCGLLLSLSL
ncbi:Carbohydrate esterase family 4 protein [Mycena indigotica]|uniref:chitin deacetylase n=1 Tax=Mycena indigotica TaxID=2126181 RepID=A0A8H6TDY7_9AGAR|nr:Carbohydrate esterase family 4 protein [Mycena indigotica]KAF7314992.1 Carbohydrate esterase family 4 protein [Mycena indigotica]